MIVEQLRAVGIEMRLQQFDIAQVVARVYGGGPDWEASYLYTIGGGYPSGEFDFATNGATNAGGYSDPQMDRLITASITQPGLGALYEYEVYASAQVPAILTSHRRTPCWSATGCMASMNSTTRPASWRRSN